MQLTEKGQPFSNPILEGMVDAVLTPSPMGLWREEKTGMGPRFSDTGLG